MAIVEVQGGRVTPHKLEKKYSKSELARQVCDMHDFVEAQFRWRAISGLLGFLQSYRLRGEGGDK